MALERQSSVYAWLEVNSSILSVSRASLLCTWCPPPVWLSMEDSRRPLELHVGPPLIYQWHYWLTEHLFTLTHEYSIYSYFKGTKDISIYGREAASLSLFSLFLFLAISLFTLPLPTSLYMYNLNICSNMQALISCACFIRGVDQETFFPWHFEQANTILHRLWKIPFVLCQHKHINLRLSLLSKQQISSEARREIQEMHVGPSISPSSAEAPLIPHGPRVFISQRGHA